MPDNGRERVLNAQGVATQRIILDAAGKIFAHEGYAGACIRAISEESGVGLSSIVYHFKSKKNLYLQTIHHFVIEKSNLNQLFTPLVTLDENSNPQEIADALRDTIHSFLGVCHGPARAEHMTELYTHILSDGDPEALAMLLECFVDVQQFFPVLLRRYRPALSDEEIAFWMQLFWSQLQYTVMGRALVLHDMRLGDSYPEVFLDASAWYFARNCCLPLDLPEPTRYPGR